MEKLIVKKQGEVTLAEQSSSWQSPGDPLFSTIIEHGDAIQVYLSRHYQEFVFTENETWFGYILEDQACLIQAGRDHAKWQLEDGDHFSVTRHSGLGIQGGSGSMFLVSFSGQHGRTMVGQRAGGPAALRYIDGCHSGVLIPPVHRGDPCLNRLLMPSQCTQTEHVHPSLRITMPIRGNGEIVVEGEAVPLEKGAVYILQANTPHYYRTQEKPLEVIAFHPDSDTGYTNRDHPMLNRTIVKGVSARELPGIATT